ncbi:MAG: class I SAM-dependent methyltransferase [Gammaproteobacteria bacterium]
MAEGVVTPPAVDGGRLTAREYWESRWDRVRLPFVFDPARRDPVAREIAKIFAAVLPRQAALDVLEIGGAPGQFLAYLALEYGFRAHALDYSAVGCAKIRENFALLGRELEVYERDLFGDLGDLPRFDIVLSMGFIEHFDDFAAAVVRHVGLLKPGGLLVLGVPNYRGVAAWAMRRLAPRHLALHNLAAMDERNWTEFARAFGLDTVFQGYIGGIQPQNWRRCERPTLANQALRFSFKLAAQLTRRSAFLRRYNSRHWSAYLLGVYRKPASG